MQADDTTTRRATLTLLKTAALAVFYAATTAAGAAQSTQPETQATPAFMFLEMPATAARPASEWGVLSFTYDAEAGAPLRRRGTSAADDGNVKGTLILAKATTAPPLLAKTPYGALEILETDGARHTLRRLTFRNVEVVNVGPDGDAPALRVSFTAESVSVH